MKDLYTLFTVIIILGSIIFVVRRLMGPTANKRVIDESIALLQRRLSGARGAYVPASGIYEAFKEDCTDPYNLRNMAYDILSHCGMTASGLELRSQEVLDSEGAAGTYSHQNGISTITIRVSRYARDNVVLAVLIHECMHYFLRHSGISFSDTHENEILTDTATVYMGFFEYMYHGYIMVGYLRDSELLYVKKALEADQSL